MSNFTRSILYSTSVLVAGLVAIFAIYSNVATTPNGSNVAQISPAAGGSDLGISINTPMDDIASDAQSLIGPEADDAMHKAVDQIDSTINEFEAIEGSTNGEKGSSYHDGQQSFELASDLSTVEQEMRDDLNKNVLDANVDSIVDRATAEGIRQGGPAVRGSYVGQRWITYRCRFGRDNDYTTCTGGGGSEGGNQNEICTTHTGATSVTTVEDQYDGSSAVSSRGGSYDNYYWGTCRRRTTFEEDMEYNKAKVKASTSGIVDNSINEAINNAGIASDPNAQDGMQDALDSATASAISKAPASVRSEVEQAIRAERRRRGL